MAPDCKCTRDDRRADPVEQRHPSHAIERLDGGDVGGVLHLRGEELVEDRISGASTAGPLRMQLGLRIGPEDCGSVKRSAIALVLGSLVGP